MTCACGHCDGEGHPALTLDIPDLGALAHVDPDDLAKSLTRAMRARGVGSKVAGQQPDGELSPWPALREVLQRVRAIGEEQGRRMQTDVEATLARMAEKGQA